MIYYVKLVLQKLVLILWSCLRDTIKHYERKGEKEKHSVNFSVKLFHICVRAVKMHMVSDITDTEETVQSVMIAA